MAVEVAVAIFSGIALVNLIATWAMIRLSGRWPKIRSLRERRNISAAITVGLGLIIGLAINARVGEPIKLDQAQRTAILSVAIGLPSFVNAIWLVRYLLTRRRADESPGVVDPDAARSELRHAIMNSAMVDLASFYRDHPEWLDDERSQANVERLRQTLKHIVELLDKYDIEAKA